MGGQQQRPRFDLTISLGNILTMSMIVVSALVAWSNYIHQNEQILNKVSNIEKNDAKQDALVARLVDAASEIKIDVASIKARLER